MIKADTRKFKIDLEKLSDLMDIPLKATVKKLSFEILNGLIKSSPRDTGYFQSSWNYAVDEIDLENAPPPPKVVDSISSEEAAQQVLSKAKTRQYAVGPYSLVMMTNSLPYAKDLEDGKSQQSPAGVVGPVVDEREAYYRRTMSEIRSELRKKR